MEKHEDVSDFELGSCAHVLVVLDVLVSPSSVVTEFCEVFSCCSDWEDVVLLSFCLSKKRTRRCASTQEERCKKAYKGKRSR